uniref:Uncharacterized protein n=2 Tax=Brassica oleracea TaxID=3712 RepID=A0A0D3CYP2_BRAOL|nr:unnamed protein product [Brassica oleracea]
MPRLNDRSMWTDDSSLPVNRCLRIEREREKRETERIDPGQNDETLYRFTKRIIE